METHSMTTCLRLPGEPETTKEYANDPGSRRWNKRAQAMRERRFAQAPTFTPCPKVGLQI
jgi:hypothetical protein